MTRCRYVPCPQKALPSDLVQASIVLRARVACLYPSLLWLSSYGCLIVQYSPLEDQIRQAGKDREDGSVHHRFAQYCFS
jgi:hypothetical protein